MVLIVAAFDFYDAPFYLFAAKFEVKPKGKYVNRNLASSFVIFPSLSKSYL